MARQKLYRNSAPALVAALVVSAGLQLVVAVAYVHFNPPPDPELSVKQIGTKGTGGEIHSTPAGIVCGEECAARFPEGTEVKLQVIPREGSIFLGWRNCKSNTEHPRECVVTVTDHMKAVRARFDKVPEAAEVDFVTLDDPKDNKKKKKDETKISLPTLAQVAKIKPKPIKIIKKKKQPKKLKLPQLTRLAPPKKPKPKPKKVAVVKPKPQPKKKKKKLRKPKRKMVAVEVPDKNEVKKAPKDARFLSDKNRNVKEETRARQTNLEKQKQGKKVASAKSKNQDEKIGGEKHKVAQTETSDASSLEAKRNKETSKSGKKQRAVGVKTGKAGKNGERGQAGDGSKSKKPGMLAMRGITGRGPPGGPVVVAEPGKGRGGSKGRRGKKGKPGFKSQLDYKAYERIVGKDKVKREVEVGRRRKSHRKGRYSKKLAAIRSSLENFTPRVRPGNQTALKTRAAPFAVYIARIHRKIHELWGFGFLESLDRKPATHPMNNWSLQTIIELAVNPDGTIDRTTIVRGSGVLTFDVAALDVIYSAGPYLAPPTAIRSPDKKAYMHWVFRRDWQQCGTFNVRPFILDKAPSGKQIDDGKMLTRSRRKHLMRARNRSNQTSKTGNQSKARGQSARAHLNLATPDDPRAKHAAGVWLTGFTRGNVPKMLTVSGTPFKSGKSLIANQLSTVGKIYRSIIKETRSRGIRQFKLVSAAGYRKRFGRLPPGITDGTDQVLMVVRLRKEQFTVLLKQKADKNYQVVGFYR